MITYIYRSVLFVSLVRIRITSIRDYLLISYLFLVIVYQCSYFFPLIVGLVFLKLFSVCIARFSCFYLLFIGSMFLHISLVLCLFFDDRFSINLFLSFVLYRLPLWRLIVFSTNSNIFLLNIDARLFFLYWI